MEDTVAPKSKPGILLLIAATVLLVLRAFLHYAVAMRKTGDLSYALSYSAARTVSPQRSSQVCSAFQRKVGHRDALL
ncbi:MAG: hypothetical protein PSW75_09915 [bacterium]|nr:hypothetical protein [bacterium]